MIWSWIKSYLRRYCTYKFKDLEAKLPDVIENKLPIEFVRRAQQHCLRYMSAYRLGLTGAALEYTVRIYKCHRSIPSKRTREQLEIEFERLSIKKKMKIFQSSVMPQTLD